MGSKCFGHSQTSNCFSKVVNALISSCCTKCFQCESTNNFFPSNCFQSLPGISTSKTTKSPITTSVPTPLWCSLCNYQRQSKDHDENSYHFLIHLKRLLFFRTSYLEIGCCSSPH